MNFCLGSDNLEKHNHCLVDTIVTTLFCCLNFAKMSCTACFQGFVHTHASPRGTMGNLYGIQTYIAGALEQAKSPSTIILVTDVFGLNLVNNKLLADYFAAASGCRVLVPDIVPGGGVPLSVLGSMENFKAPLQWWDVPGYVSRLLSLVRLAPHFFPIVMGTAKASDSLLNYTKAVRADLPAGAKLGVAGYCWGAMQTTKLSMAGGEKQPLVDAHYMAHPSSIKIPDDIITSLQTFQVPLSIAVAERDFTLSGSRAMELEARLRSTIGPGAGEGGYNWEIVIYEGCEHGFACRANRNKVMEDEAANKAALQAVDWFLKWLV